MSRQLFADLYDEENNQFELKNEEKDFINCQNDHQNNFND